MSKSINLVDKIAVITGGARGFGLAIAQAFIHAGAGVVLTSRYPETVQKTVTTLRSQGARVSGMACNVIDPQQVQALADFAIDTFGRFDIWINNAGLTAPYGPTIHIQPETFEKVTHTNILGTYYGSLVAMRHFLNRGEGKLINVLKEIT
jgi:glucose 1-dehydrogenase